MKIVYDYGFVVVDGYDASQHHTARTSKESVDLHLALQIEVQDGGVAISTRGKHGSVDVDAVGWSETIVIIFYSCLLFLLLVETLPRAISFVMIIRYCCFS